jgi:hypothetical protein
MDIGVEPLACQSLPAYASSAPSASTPTFVSGASHLMMHCILDSCTDCHDSSRSHQTGPCLDSRLGRVEGMLILRGTQYSIITFDAYNCLGSYRCDSTASMNQPSANSQSRNVVADNGVRRPNDEKGTIDSQRLQSLAAQEKTVLNSIAKSFVPRLQNRGACAISHHQGRCCALFQTQVPF